MTMRFKNIKIGVIQPGMNNISIIDVTREELLEHQKKLAAAIYDALHNPWFAHGDHCKFCKHAPNCDHLRQGLIDEFESIPSPTKDDKAEELGKAMEWVPVFQGWCRAVTEAVNGRLNDGLPVAGYKLVEGRHGNRKWDNENVVADELESLDLEPEHIYQKTVLSPTRIEKLVKTGVLTKDEWQDLQGHITRAAPKPIVVQEADSRPAITPAASINDFEEIV
jgi:hypothetical protein